MFGDEQPKDPTKKQMRVSVVCANEIRRIVARRSSAEAKAKPGSHRNVGGSVAAQRKGEAVSDMNLTVLSTGEVEEGREKARPSKWKRRLSRMAELVRRCWSTCGGNGWRTATGRIGWKTVFHLSRYGDRRPNPGRVIVLSGMEDPLIGWVEEEVGPPSDPELEPAGWWESERIREYLERSRSRCEVAKAKLERRLAWIDENIRKCDGGGSLEEWYDADQVPLCRNGNEGGKDEVLWI